MSEDNSFVHLHVHSMYSSMRGVCSIEALCAATRAQGVDALALTETNGLYGAIRFIETARAYGLRPLLGVELTHADHRAVMLVTSPNGYANLCRLISARHCDPAFDLVDAVRSQRSGLIILTDDGPALEVWAGDGRDGLFVELTPGPRMHHAWRLSAKLQLPSAATNRVHFIRPEEFATHQLLRAIACNTTLSRLAASEQCGPTHWLWSGAKVAAHFPHAPEAVTNTRRIADRCFAGWDFSNTIFPAHREASDRDAFELLRAKAYAGALQRYGAIALAVQERLEHELTVIRDRGYAQYFLLVEDIVRCSPITCGRGSAAASIVAYCLGLTHADPIRHGLLFDRFLNASRNDPPDIDIDFPWDERDGLIERVLKTANPDRAAMVATHTTLGVRGAVREVARVYGMPPAEIDRVAAYLVREVEALEVAERPAGASWAFRLCREPRLGRPWPEILDHALRIVGHVRDLAVHCGGLVTTPDAITEYVPLEISAKGVPVIQWEKDQAEAAGLVKIDLLGNRSLSVIRDALAAIEANTGRRLEYGTWDPTGDPATEELIRRGDTLGCFYIESPATRLLLKKLWTRMPADRRACADVFEYLVVVSSLVRPAAISFVHQLVRRAHGERYEPLHTALADVLDDTHGIMVYQEDVTRVAVALAGFSVEEADDLRKTVSKRKVGHRQLREFYGRFTRGAAARGVSPQAIETIWKMIMSFAGYSFCKPHSVSYAQVSMKSAYLRAHYPAEFMAAVMSNEGGYYSAFAYLSEARRMGLAVLPPDVNESAVKHSGAGRTLRLGFMQIKGLSRLAAGRIVAERETGGPYHSFEDFVRRARPAPAEARALVRAGACDGIAHGLSRPALLWRLYTASLDDAGAAGLPTPDEYPLSTRIRHEIETLGFPLTCHPLDLYRRVLGKVTYVPANEMADHVGCQVTMIGWLITEKITHTRTGDLMEFVTFEDHTGLYEATLFPDVYRRCALLLSPNRPYAMQGIVEDDLGALTLTVRHLRAVVGDGPAERSEPVPLATRGA